MSDDGSSSSRREILRLAAAAAAATVMEGKAAAQGRTDPPVPSRVPQWALAIDLARCSRCEACVVACAAENNIPPVGAQHADQVRAIHWMDMLDPDPRRGSFALGPWPVPIPCMHCERPECVKVCPVEACYRSDDGVVIQVWDRCIGCRACMVACPYGRRYYNWAAPGSAAASANPDVALRPAGVVEKCTLCQHRIRAASARARLDDEPLTDAQLRLLPACAAACPSRAITFGDRSDPQSTIAKLAQSPRAITLLAHLGTRPRVFYLRGKP